ncbi:hypothetical protein MSUIS_05510 [Mycoplasma suis KI3806]|uniref:Uncharacterized protein n=1 Tax=Mycoplasma suis (strain KI_3806) TaxID=708248 RepID=F0V1W3_MYCS3|nr:hypothetical protein [Mycoplasma suis]CBZ40644.1 hypothetical protein MSUIS_05510 [Mycoplasma suis KI3806]
MIWGTPSKIFAVVLLAGSSIAAVAGGGLSTSSPVRQGVQAASSAASSSGNNNGSQGTQQQSTQQTPSVKGPTKVFIDLGNTSLAECEETIFGGLKSYKCNQELKRGRIR